MVAAMILAWSVNPSRLSPGFNGSENLLGYFENHHPC